MGRGDRTVPVVEAWTILSMAAAQTKRVTVAPFVANVMNRHPAVLAAAVVAQPDPRWGETPCAFVELKPEAVATEDEIVAHCREHLARFKVPKRVIFGELPKTSTGKIQK